MGWVGLGRVGLVWVGSGRATHTQIYPLTRAPAGGGRVSAPLRFFEDSEKTAARSGAKFCIAVPSSFIQIP